ncbi:hypothetical protein FSARC_2699 [Fusarium sarcochroum]|uniref:Uncharacterized protein n=1 Tax=Fusarium sarcochroum TaxID=1208366 RepID=A0A8H4U5L5_9HYPO|nr:hypothetical protein FSARC_2699 [Fusarium sarcochroum]
MSSLFCCDAIKPYRPQHLSHQSKFNNFMAWGSFPRASSVENDDKPSHDLSQVAPLYAVQLVQQVNFGPLESKRYFIPTGSTESDFVEVTENDLIQANFQKVNTHNKFFEVNIYQKDPVNKHHWRANIARPAGSIDI